MVHNTGSQVCLVTRSSSVILQVIAMRLNVKLSPDQERQLLETSMVPIIEEEDHILTIQTTSAIPAPAAPLNQIVAPAILGPSSSTFGKLHQAACLTCHC